MTDLVVLRDSLAYDLIFVTETWLNDSISDAMLCGPYYRVLRRDRVNRQGGGVLILAKKSITLVQIAHPVGLGEDLELLTADMKTRGAHFRLICVYRPPNASNQFSLDLWRLLSNLSTEKFPVLIGDFNLPCVDWKFLCRNKVQNNLNNHVLNEFLNFVRSFNMSQFIEEATCGKNVLDLVLCNEPQVVLECEVTEPFVFNAVHKAIDFSLYVKDAPRDQVAKLEYFIYFKNADYVEMGKLLDSVNWEEIFDGCRNVQDFWDLFSYILSSVIETFVPWKLKPEVRASSLPVRLQRLKKKKSRLWKKRDFPGKDAQYAECAGKYSKEVKKWARNRETAVLKKGPKSFFQFR